MKLMSNIEFDTIDFQKNNLYSAPSQFEQFVFDGVQGYLVRPLVVQGNLALQARLNLAKFVKVLSIVETRHALSLRLTKLLKITRK